MYDSVKCWLPVDNAGSQYHEFLCETLDSPEQKLKGNSLSTAGYLKNLRIGCYDRGVSIQGSIAKYYLEDNFNTLTRSSTQKAIEKLSDQLKIDINDAEVKRLDVATNFLMNYEPEVYYPLLGESQYYQKIAYPNSLYFSNGNRTKLFYNKVVEGKKKGYTIPEIWQGKPVLRYEMRYTQRLNKTFNRYSTKAIDLYQEVFYMQVLDNWQKEYYNIEKSKKIQMNYNAIEKPKDFKDQLILRCIEDYGLDAILSEIETLRKLEVFKQREYYSNLKKDLKKMAKKPGQTEDHELIKELDKKVSRITKYYR